jgi:LPPG:FO 2-phospho-L-lactate transferase
VNAVADPALQATVICPSNPMLSILPILRVPGLRTLLERRTAPLIAVSPIVGGQAVKGPAAKIMAELGMEVSPAGIAAFYGDLIDGLVIDALDRALAPSIAGPRVLVTNTLMNSLDDKRRLAEDVLTFSTALTAHGQSGPA